MKVAQVLSAAGPVDAVTNQGLAWRRVFERWGWEGADYAAYVAPGIPAGRLRGLRELRPQADEILLVHYSGYVRGLESLLELAPRSLLMSHNVTPARYFWAHDPVTAAHCELAARQLADLSTIADALAAVSDFNARDLRRSSGREAAVIPVLFDEAGLPPAPSGLPPGTGDERLAAGPTILFVGRLTPHKRQDLVIRAFARYRRSRPDARLVLVGLPLSADFEATLHALAAELAPGAVSFQSQISAQELALAYAGADVFLCLSEHEGFCIPLLEAFHYGVPVIARDSGAVGDVVEDAGVLLGREDGIATVAELLRIVVEDQELREELRARGRRRLEAFNRERTASLLRAELELLGSH